MALAFVHISDIHFGQEKGGQTVVDDDVKKSIIKECKDIFANMPDETIRGVIATGDVAYSGKSAEYEKAGIWFDELTTAINCLRSNVFIVPGNHDIDRDKISESGGEMLKAIAAEGDAKLDKYLATEIDRKLLLSRFVDYGLFAQGYDCPIDDEGVLAGNHPLEIAEGRVIRFVGLNSALICGAGDIKGRLLLGARQRVVPSNEGGEELVVLMHHPLDWLLDSQEASSYLRSRARVVISGHEHLASSRLEAADNGAQVLMISAGATVPPAHEGKRYCFNIITFDWDECDGKLKVTIDPREWNAGATKFFAGTAEIGGVAQTHELDCPNYKPIAKLDKIHHPVVASHHLEVPAVSNPSITIDDEEYALLVLRFFRDIEELERLNILYQLKIIPRDFKDAPSHSIQRRFLDKARDVGKIDEIKIAINALS
jgi:predicted phosphodiesterase